MTNWNTPCCYNCEFHDDPNGRCRRYPPQIYAEEGYEVWPRVADSDWCGEFKWKDRDEWKKTTKRMV